MFYVYILKLQNGQYYIGYTTNLEDRLARHRKGEACVTTERIPMESISFTAAFTSEKKSAGF